MLAGYLLALSLTLVIEGCCAYVMGFRERKYTLAVAVINVITHLILSYLLFVLRYLGIDVPLAFIVLLEALVVVAEWQLLVFVFRNPKGRFLTTALLGNRASFRTGMLVFASW